MQTEVLLAQIERRGDDGVVVRSPVVGVLDDLPGVGVYLHPLQTFAYVNILGRKVPLKLPRDVQGRVVERNVAGTYTPVDYGRTLLTLSLAAAPMVASAGAAAPKAEAHAGLVPVRTPSQGVFYRRPSPDSPPFVEEGSAVTAGTVLGVVEVMKCFNQITYGGPSVPPAGKVAKILAADASEVGFDQVIMLIEPG
ncbi:MAG: hypothetical protein HY903_13820 [Deltaproteobacteria bacterium]|nr:hypothetical protein [Deltaproteobacteria bacterium]